MRSIWDSFSQDFKYSARTLWASPVFTAAAVLALALGIGANTAMFSVVNAVLLHPLVFSDIRQPSRLVTLWEKNPSLSPMFANHLSPRLRSFQEWKRQSRSFEDLAIWSTSSLTITSAAGQPQAKPEELQSVDASSNFFPLLGTGPLWGRNFRPDEMQPGKGRVAIVTYSLAQSRFGGVPQALGRFFTAAGKEYRIVGVLSPKFAFSEMWSGSDKDQPQIWLPFEMSAGNAQGDTFASGVIARLKPGVTIGQARAEMNVIGERLAHSQAERYSGFGINVSSIYDEDVSHELRQALIVLQGSVLLVLLIACANVGNLQLIRATTRVKEIAVRYALGASASRVVRQIMTESLLLSFLGAAVGVFLAYAGVRLLVVLAPEDIHGLHELRIDGVVLIFTTAVACLAGLLFGLAPASRTLKRDLNPMLARGARGFSSSSNATRHALGIIEIALSVILLIGAGLMVKSLFHLMNTDLGFDRDHLLVMRMSLPDSRYRTRESLATFNNRLIESVRQTPGLLNAALTTALPMRTLTESSFELPDRTFKRGTFPVSDWARASDGYFETLRIRVLKGRVFTRDEALASEPNVAVVNQTFVQTFFAHRDPLDKSFVFGDESSDKTKYRIIGVVADEHQLGPDKPQRSEFYLPGTHLRSMLLVTRTSGDPLLLANTLKQKIWNLDKDLPIAGVGTEEEALKEWIAPRRFNMTVLLNFAGVALLLSAVGLYSVLAYLVTLRTREIGIRMALGAESRAVARLILKQGLLMTAAGIVLGIAGAFAMTRFMQSLISGVSPTDPATFLLVPLLLIAVAALASYLPAIRAVTINPVEALRTE